MGKSKKKSVSEMDVDGEAETQVSEQTNGKEPLPTPTTEKGEYEDLIQFCNPIAQPMASRKLAKKAYKLVKKSSKVKFHCRQGIVDVQRALRKQETGIVILAGDVTPIDIYAHIPAMCEEASIPYCYTPSKHHLGLAAGHRRPSIMVMIKKHESYADDYAELHAAVDALVIPD